MIKRISILLVLGLVLGIPYGCKKTFSINIPDKSEEVEENNIIKDEDNISGDEKEDVNEDENSNIIKDEEKGEENISEGEKLELPEKFPTDLIPIIEGAKLKESVEQHEDGSYCMKIILTSDKSTDVVREFYGEKLFDNLRNTISVGMSGNYSVSGEKDNYAISVGISKTTINPPFYINPRLEAFIDDETNSIINIVVSKNNN